MVQPLFPFSLRCEVVTFKTFKTQNTKCRKCLPLATKSCHIFRSSLATCTSPTNLHLEALQPLRECHLVTKVKPLPGTRCGSHSHSHAPATKCQHRRFTCWQPQPNENRSQSILALHMLTYVNLVVLQSIMNSVLH